MLNRSALAIIILSAFLLIEADTAAQTKDVSKAASIRATATVINPAGMMILARRPADNLAASESKIMHLKLAESLAFHLPEGSSMILNLKSDQFQTSAILSEYSQSSKLKIEYEKGRAIIKLEDILSVLPDKAGELVVTVIPADI